MTEESENADRKWTKAVFQRDANFGHINVRHEHDYGVVMASSAINGAVSGVVEHSEYPLQKLRDLALMYDHIKQGFMVQLQEALVEIVRDPGSEVSLAKEFGPLVEECLRHFECTLHASVTDKKETGKRFGRSIAPKWHLEDNDTKSAANLIIGALHSLNDAEAVGPFMAGERAKRLQPRSR